jgi:hypothetical protein
MPRLPQPGTDKGIWGDILNDFLSQSLNVDGTLKDIPQSKVVGLSTDLQSKASTAELAAYLLKPVILTQVQYDALAAPDPNILYLITG